jgi:hypothetical protein
MMISVGGCPFLGLVMAVEVVVEGQETSQITALGI